MYFSFLRPAIVTLLAARHALAITADNAVAAFDQLQKWYNHENGLWIPSTGWWNSANCLTVIADLAAINPTVAESAPSIFSETFTKAQQYNSKMIKTTDAMSQPLTLYSDHWPFIGESLMSEHATQGSGGFLNGYYDDQGWWTLGWIAAYDVTQNAQYLSMAEEIFADSAAIYGTTPCGGIWWDKAHTYVNAIANELFVSAAAYLSNRPTTRHPPSYYLQSAQDSWTWFLNSGMINAQSTINDGLDSQTCKNNGRTVWSYNQGVILGGLTELARATGDASYTATAKTIADAAITALSSTNDGVLRDACEPNCGADGTQFKGVFARNLAALHKASPESRYRAFLRKNADALWAHDRLGRAELSVVWNGPFVAPANASTQSSALDCIVGALSA